MGLCYYKFNCNAYNEEGKVLDEDFDVIYADTPEQGRAYEAQGRERCLRCGGYWFREDKEGSTCSKCWAEVMEKD